MLTSSLKAHRLAAKQAEQLAEKHYLAMAKLQTRAVRMKGKIAEIERDAGGIVEVTPNSILLAEDHWENNLLRWTFDDDGNILSLPDLPEFD
jgi:hypothetical protein